MTSFSAPANRQPLVELPPKRSYINEVASVRAATKCNSGKCSGEKKRGEAVGLKATAPISKRGRRGAFLVVGGGLDGVCAKGN